MKNVTLELPEKGLIFIVGKSGCGKTTLLNMIGAVDTPTSGTLSIYGRETDLNNPTLADAYRSKYIGFVFQEYNLLENDTVTENIRLAGVLSHETLDVSSALEDVGLAEYADRYANELSGGQKQRVAVARSLAKNSAVILADEPTGNLDSATGKEIFKLLKKVSEKCLVVVVTHDREAANKYGERVKVYTMGTFSKEICGGPHAGNTGDLGHFKIKKEEASSSGVRRIKAVLEY